MATTSRPILPTKELLPSLIEELSLPTAYFANHHIVQVNQAFKHRVAEQPLEIVWLNGNQRIQHLLNEATVVNDALTFDFTLPNNHSFHCTVSPVARQPGTALLFFEDISQSLQSDKNNALIYRLSLLLASPSQTLKEKLQAAVDQLLFEAEIFDCSIHLLDTIKGQLDIVAWGTTDISSNVTEKKSLALGQGVVGYVAVQEKTLVIPHILDDPRFIKQPTDDKDLTLLCLPIIENGYCYGVLSLTRLPQLSFTDREVQNFTTIANRLAMLIESNSVKTQEIQQAEFLQLISSSRDIVKDYDRIVDLLGQILSFNHSHIVHWDQQSKQLTLKRKIAEKSFPPIAMRELKAYLLQAGTVARLCRSQYLTLDHPFPAELQGAVIFPLISRHQLIGFIFGQNTAWQRRLSKQELLIGASLAGQLATAIENNAYNEEILDERKKLTQIQNTLHDGLILYDADHKILMYNQAAKRLLGIKRDLTGLTWEIALNNEVERYCRFPLIRHFDPTEFLHRAVDDGQVSHGLATIPSQPPKTVEITVSPVYDRHNKINGILSHFRDITQVYDLQKKMAARVQELTNLFKISSVTGFNSQQIVSRVLDLVLELLQVKAAQLILCEDQSPPSLITVATVGESKLLNSISPKLMNKIEATMKSKEPKTVQLKHNKASRQLLISPLLGENRAANGAIVVVDDNPQRSFSREEINLLSIVSAQITSKLDMAWLLSEIESDRNKLAAIIGQSVDGILVIDPDQTIQIWNSALERLTGIKEAEARQGHTHDVRHMVETLQQTERDDLTEMKIRNRLTGQPIWLGITYAPILNGQELTGYIALVRDISRQKELEASKNEFVSTASHELRSPITAITGYLSMLKRGDAGLIVNKQQAFFVDKAYQNAKRMVNIVEDLLMTTRMETGQIRYKIQSVKIADLIDTIISDIRFLAEEKAITIRLDRLHQVCVRADPNGLHRALTNLLTNAIKYTPKRGRIKIFFKNLILNGQTFLQTAIQDSGVGIDTTDQDKIFEKFSRIDNPLSVSAGGTGLGLYITKSIIEELGGQITVKSSKDKGSTFYVNLPLAEQPGKERTG